MKRIKKIYLLFALCLVVQWVTAQGQWTSFSEGIGEVSSNTGFSVEQIITLSTGTTYAFIAEHTAGENADGVYVLNADRWQKIAPRINQYGYASIAMDDDRIYAIPAGAEKMIYELVINQNQGEWDKVMDIPDKGIVANRMDITAQKAYIHCRIVESDITDFPDENFTLNEVFVIQLNLSSGTSVLLRDRNNPLIINTRGGNNGKPIALTNGKVYTYSTFDYRENDGRGGLYEWNGTQWSSASAGLDAINTTGSGFGPIGPIFTDPGHNRLLISTEQGFFEKVEGGWIKYFTSQGSNIYVATEALYIASKIGNVKIIEGALSTTYKAASPSCIDRVDRLTPFAEEGSFLAELRLFESNNGDCDTSSSPKRSGIFKYEIEANQKPVQNVTNLHLTTGTYLGGKGEKNISGTAILDDGSIIVAGNFTENATENVTPLFGASPEDIGKVLILDASGTQVLRSIPLGSALLDMDTNEHGEIALIGSFGVAVLNPDFSVKWVTSELTGETGRIAISEESQVVALLASEGNGAGIIKLYGDDGAVIHTNDALDNNGVTINDLEISNLNGHDKYYVTGYTQASSVLQVAFIYAYGLNPSPSRTWKTWGFGRNEVNTGENGADTRGYRLKAVADHLYVACETAGGGPGGFTVLAYNGLNLNTRVALENNDTYTNGTNSCGSCHITFLGKVDPLNGEVVKGKFFHSRLSNGKTNTHRVRYGDLDVDTENNVYVTGVAASEIENRDVFNINGQLTGRYAGSDQFVLITDANFDNRSLWGNFSKSEGGGAENRIAVNGQKVVYLANTNKGTLMTTDNANRSVPYNDMLPDGTLASMDTYLAVWDKDIASTANNDEIVRPFIADTECFRVDDRPCTEQVLPPSEAFRNLIKPFNMITPNGDLRNDTWRIDHLGQAGSYKIFVFSQTGQVVYSSSEYTQEWDGYYQNKLLPKGVYFYTIYIDDNKMPISGYITIAY